MILRINDRIRNRKVEHFNSFRFNLRYDSVASTFSFNAYFNPENSEHKDLFCIGHYHKCTLEHNGELLLTGYILSQVFNSGSSKELIGLGGYSLPGVLEDCHIFPDKVSKSDPILSNTSILDTLVNSVKQLITESSSYPLQSDTLSLKEIASKLITPFGLKMIIDPVVSKDMDSPFESTNAGETQTIKDYLTELAAQKNIILTHNEYGNLVFTRAKTDQQPVLDFGEIPGTSMSLSFNGQNMHSHISVLKQQDFEEDESVADEFKNQFTVRNPYVPYVFRPKVVVQTSGTSKDTPKVAKSALASELRSLTLKITIDRWDINKKLIKPNSIVAVKNPDIYLYDRTKWFVEEVEYSGDNESMTAVLTCVLPEVYNGKTPEYLFKGINEH